MMFQLLKFLFCVLLLQEIVCVSEISSSNNVHFRLDRNVIPKTYDIIIYPDLENSTFNGEVTIYVHLKFKTKEIVLHSKNLSITECNIDFSEKPTKFSFNYQYDTLVLEKMEGKVFEPGSHVIYLKFEGIMTKSSGLTKVPYTYNNKTGYVVVSDLQPALARTIYPCFDEPYFKANFLISIGVPNSSYVALSNMQNIGTFKTDSNKTVYQFQKTPKMSTYLTAFVVTDYPYEEIIWNNGGIPTPVRMYSPFIEESHDNNILLLNDTVRFLEYFADYTGIRYPLPKLDMIEYNRTIAATENWGLITYTNGLLSLSQHKYHINQTTEVIAHEISHSWFGNLVTVDWWTDIWLQEGFAAFFTEKSINNVFNSKLNNWEYSMTLVKDKHVSYPVVRALETIGEVDKQFRDLIYVKGKTILSMLELVIGPVKFQKIIRRFLGLYQYNVATTDDFISCIEEVLPDFDSRGFLVSWLYQNRYPIIYVVSEENSTFVFRQEVYYANESATFNSLRYKWTIPLTYVTNNSPNSTLVWFQKESEVLTLKLPKEVKWIIFNTESTGLYRFNYTISMWNSFIENIQEFTTAQLTTITNEAASLFYGGEINCSVVFRLLLGMFKEGSEKSLQVLEDYFHLVAHVRYYFLRTNQTAYEKVRNLLQKFDSKLPERIPKEILEQKFGNTTGDRMKRLQKYPKCLEKLPECTEWINENL